MFKMLVDSIISNFSAAVYMGKQRSQKLEMSIFPFFLNMQKFQQKNGKRFPKVVSVMIEDSVEIRRVQSSHCNDIPWAKIARY